MEAASEETKEMKRWWESGPHLSPTMYIKLKEKTSTYSLLASVSNKPCREQLDFY